MMERRPLGNVLVATDFSGAATCAVERAARLPISPGSALTVLHVLRPGCRPEDRADAERALDYAASVAVDAALRVGRRDVDILPRLVEGAPFVEIIRVARHGRNELIVVGRHGERTFRDLLLGSTAERVIRHGDASILVVASRPMDAYGRPIVAVDCSDTSRRAAELAWRLTDPAVDALTVVHAYGANEMERAAQVGVETFLASGDAAVPARVIAREGDARRVILDAAVRHAADLLAIGTHGRSGLAHVLLGSVAEAVVRAAGCDVLVARAVGLPFKLA